MSERLTGEIQSRSQLAKLLRDVADLVEDGGAKEGVVSWLRPLNNDPLGTFARVEARYRTHGDEYTIVGEWVDENNHIVRHMNPGEGKEESV